MSSRQGWSWRPRTRATPPPPASPRSWAWPARGCACAWTAPTTRTTSGGWWTPQRSSQSGTVRRTEACCSRPLVGGRPSSNHAIFFFERSSFGFVPPFYFYSFPFCPLGVSKWQRMPSCSLITSWRSLDFKLECHVFKYSQTQETCSLTVGGLIDVCIIYHCMENTDRKILPLPVTQFPFPPGFRLNASSWPMFLLKTLNGAEMAPSRIFHKVPAQGSTCCRREKHCGGSPFNPSK